MVVGADVVVAAGTAVVVVDAGTRLVVVAGSSIQAYSPASRGDLALVGECDYQSFLPPDPTAITGLTANSLSHLSARLSRLGRLCSPTADEEAPQVSGQSQRR